MIKQAFAVAATVAFAGAAALAPASAMTVTSGHYTQTTGGFSCYGQVTDDGDGGVMSVRVRGGEFRPEDKHFRTWTIATRLVAQEKSYNGTWVNVKRGKAYYGWLGATRDRGDYNFSPFHWAGAGNHPRLAISVLGQDDNFRVRVVTRLYDDEGVMIKRLVTREGTCRL